MKFSKTTPDRYFKLSIESDLLSDDEDDNEQIPIDSLSQLILELELITYELKQLLLDDKEVKNAH